MGYSLDNDRTENGVIRGLIGSLVLPAAICAAGVTLFWSLPANAQSFNCAGAERPAEFAICNNEELLTMDEKMEAAMSTTFVRASTSPQRQAVVREHESWLKRRNACGNDMVCLNLRYNEQLKLLNSRDS